MADIKEMIKELQENPEKIDDMTNGLDDMTDEQLDALMKEVTPYGTSLSPDDKRILAFAHTNMREEYIMKFMMTSVAAFMYRRMKEFRISEHKDDEVKENVIAKKVVKKFLASIFEYDPDAHVQECAKPPKTADEMMAAKKAIYVGDDNQQTMPTDDEIKDVIWNKGLEPVTTPNDTYYWLRTYMNDNFQQLRWATMILHGTLPSVELMFQPCEVFDGPDPQAEYETYERAHSGSLQFGITACTFGKWGIIGSFDKNKEKVRFLNKETEVLERMAEQKKRDEYAGKDIMKRRVKKRKEENVRREGVDAKGLEAYTSGDGPGNATTGMSRALSKEERDKMAKNANTADQPPDEKMAADVNDALHDLAPDAPTDNPVPELGKKGMASQQEYANDYDPPDDAVTVNVYTTDKKKGLQKSHMFTEAIDPETEKNLREERFNELKEVDDKEAERRAQAEETLKTKKKARMKGGSRR